MVKLVKGMRWAIAVRDRSDERKKTECLRVAEVSYLVRGPLFSIYRVTRNNRMSLGRWLLLM